MSCGSSDGFLIRGRTIACLCESVRKFALTKRHVRHVSDGQSVRKFALTKRHVRHVSDGQSVRKFALTKRRVRHVSDGRSSTSISSFTSDVGIGSSSHCLFDDFLISKDTSSTVTSWNPVNNGTSRRVMLAGGALTAVAGMLSTLLVKYVLKP